jgi:hypothetical protein
MSTNNRIRVLMGLTLAGSFVWASVRDRVDADEPRDSSPPAAAASTSNERLLLLTNGRIIKGVISEQGNEYLVTQPVGVLSFPKQRVEGAFNSLGEVYRYRVGQLPERDSDERIKLAHWCLNLSLKGEAREQILKVLELNPKHPQARAMLFSMEQTAAIAAQTKRDPQVQQTGAETMAASHPTALDSAVLQGAQRGLGISGLPVIFDLPRPLAIKRANEFALYVHPVLQAYCAKCHDGRYDGEFQLVPMRSRADRTAEAFRANLDATLRLIDPENPSKSELLTSTLRAHGLGPRSRPIFPGSNDKTYQILSAWVQSLRNLKSGGDASHTPARPATDRSEPFAAERARGAGEGAEATPSALADGADRSPRTAGIVAEGKIPPPSELVRGRIIGPDGRKQEAPDEFPLPFALTGKKPNLPAPKAPTIPAPKSSMDRSGSSAAAGAGAATPATEKTGTPTGPDKTVNQTKIANEPGTQKKKTPPVTIDPTLLERALLYRNIGR